MSKIIQKAAERGYIEQTRRHGPTHAERWRSISEREVELAQLAHRRMSLAAVGIIYFLLVAWAAYLVLPD